MINRTRRALGLISRAVRSVTNPAALVLDNQQPATPAPAEAAPVTEPTDLYDTDDMPDVADIERAALSYDLAADNARRADRGKRAARKILDRLPAGTYGAWTISRKASSRQTADLDKIRAIFAEHGLGPVPMKPAAPSLVVTRTATPAAGAEHPSTAVAA